MIFFNGNSCGWIAPCSNVEGQLRLMVEELEADMLKKASQKTARSKVLAAVAEGKQEQERICDWQDRAAVEALHDDAPEPAGAGGSPSPSKGKGGGGSSRPKPPKGAEWVGRFFRLFSKKINYPTGGWLTGVVRRYSRVTKLHLAVYDERGRAPEWVDFAKTQVQALSAEKIEALRNAARKPRILSMTRGHNGYLFGHGGGGGGADGVGAEAGADAAAEQEAEPECRQCQTAAPFEPLVPCMECGARFHPSCVDPPWCKPGPDAVAAAWPGVEPGAGPGWTCPQCERCSGCGAQERELAAAAAAEGVEGPFLEEKKLEGSAAVAVVGVGGDKGRVLACARCLPKFEKHEHCPICRRVWYAEQPLSPQHQQQPQPQQQPEAAAVAGQPKQEAPAEAAAAPPPQQPPSSPPPTKAEEPAPAPMDVETQPPPVPAMNGAAPAAPAAPAAALNGNPPALAASAEGAGEQPAEAAQQQPAPPQQQQEGQEGQPPPLAAGAKAPAAGGALPVLEPLEEAKKAAAAPAWSPPQNEEDKRMLKCDHFGCPLWVHAQCERLSPEEYDAVCRDDNHPLSRFVGGRPCVVSCRVVSLVCPPNSALTETSKFTHSSP